MEMLMAAAGASHRHTPTTRRSFRDHVDDSPGFVSAMRSTAYDDDEEDNINDDYYGPASSSYSLSLRRKSISKSPASKKKTKLQRIAYHRDPTPEPEPESASDSEPSEPALSPDATTDDDNFELGQVSPQRDRPINDSFVTYNAFDPPAGMSPEPTGLPEPVEVIQTPSPPEEALEAPIEVVQPASDPMEEERSSRPVSPSRAKDKDIPKEPCPEGVTQDQWDIALKIRHNKSVAWGDYTPELLRVALPTQAAIHEFLASRWIPIKELHRLESFGVFTYKRGKFTDAEKRSLRMYLEDFQEVHQLSDAELVDLLMSKGKNTEKNRYGKFWPELAGAVPGRPVRYVKEVVKRMYDPRGRKGEWTAEEDFKLKQAYELYPNQWVKIVEEVQRTEFDCRDRWKGELKGRDSRKTGAWSDEEVQKLIDAVKAANVAAGLDPLSGDTPWDVVVTNMGGTRTRTQCRKKWQDSLQGGRAVGRRTRVGIDHMLLINRLRELDYQHERDIEWMKVPWDGQVKPATLRSTWSVIVRQVEDREDMPFREILDKLQVIVAEQNAAEMEKRKEPEKELQRKQKRREEQAKLVADAKARAEARRRKEEKKAKRAAAAAARLDAEGGAAQPAILPAQPDEEPVAVPVVETPPAVAQNAEPQAAETEKQRRKREKREKKERKERKRKAAELAEAPEAEADAEVEVGHPLETTPKKPRIEELEAATVRGAEAPARKTLWWKR